MKSNIRILPGPGSRSPDAMLEVARNAGLEDVTIIGWVGDELFFSTSRELNAEILWDLEQAKGVLLGR